MSVSTGFLNVQGDAYFDASGSTSAQFKAVNVTVNGTLTTNNISIPQLNTTNSFTVDNQLKVGTFYYINPNITQDYKDTIDSTVDTYAWDASRNGTEIPYTFDPGSGEVTYGTILPYVNLDGSFNQNFTPMATALTDINGEIYFKSKGKFREGVDDYTQPDANTLYPVWSMSKLFGGILYARMVSLGVFQLGEPVLASYYFPVLKNIKFLVPRYENSPEPTDASGVNVKDPATGESYRVPVNDDTIAREISKKYVNVYPVTRDLYLQDILGECVGIGGYADEYNGYFYRSFTLGTSDNKNYGWQAAVSDTSSFVDANGKWMGPPNSIGSKGGISPPFPQGGALPFSALFNMLAGGGNGGVGGWTSNFGDVSGNGTHYTADGSGSFCAQTPEEYITTFFTDFSGYTFMQLFDHGTWNYNSVGCWDTAILKMAYNEHFGTSYDYQEILRKEIFEPLGITPDDATYFFDNDTDPRLDRVPTIWLGYVIDPNSPYLGSPNGYIRHPYLDMATAEPTGATQTMAGGLFGLGSITGLQANNILTYPYAQRYFVDNGDANMYLGSGGIFMTLGAYNKVIQLIKHEGVYYDINGNLTRLIHAQHVQCMTTPLIDNLLETNQVQNICKTVGGYNVSRFCMGGITVGPSVSTSDGNEFQWEQVTQVPGPDTINITTSSNYLPVDGFYWAGAGGSYYYIFPGKNATFVGAGMDSFSGMGQELLQKYVNTLTNELILPGSNNPLLPFQG